MMNRSLVVSIPHRLGKQAAIARLQHGLDQAVQNFGQVLQVEEQRWSGDRLSFRVSALLQRIEGTIDVAEDHVRIEMMLPWLLARLTHGIRDVIAKRGALLLEKK
jgi:hypothetical protein